MTQTRTCSQRFYNRLASIGSYVAGFVAPLKPIANAIAELEGVQHFKSGVLQPTRALSILRHPHHFKEAQAVVARSFFSNIPNYLLISAMYRRLVNVVEEHYTPTFLQSVVATLDLAIIVGFFLRLYARRTVENALYMLSIPRAVSNDVANYLIKTVSDDLAQSMSKALSDIFFLRKDPNKLREKLANEMQIIFVDLFVNKKKSIDSFELLNEQLANLFVKTILQEDMLITSMEENANEISKVLSKLIVEEFASAILLKPTKEKEAAEAIVKRDLVRSLSGKFGADTLATNISREVAVLRRKVQPFLPVKHLESCGCELKKIGHATLSSDLYFAGNVFLTNIPSWIQSIGFSSKYLTAANALCIGLRALLNGQNLIEAKLSAAGLCTRHRYVMASRNKMRLMGEGAAFLMNVELAAYAAYFYFGVDDSFTRHAIKNFLLLLHLIPTYVFNEPLPGKKPRPLDVFLPTRKTIFWVTKGLKEWILPDFKNPDARADCIKNIRNILTSNVFHSSVLLLLGPSKFIPINEIKQLGRERYLRQLLLKKHPTLKTPKEIMEWEVVTRQEIDRVLGVKRKHFVSLEDKSEQARKIRLMEETKDLLVERENIKKLKHPMRVLCSDPTIRLFIKLFEKDIKQGVEYGELLRRASPWLIKPLSILPGQGTIISAIEVPLHLLNEASLEEIFRQIREQLADPHFLTNEYYAPEEEAICYEKPTIQEEPETKLVVSPAKKQEPETKLVISPAKKQEPETKLVLSPAKKIEPIIVEAKKTIVSVSPAIPMVTAPVISIARPIAEIKRPALPVKDRDAPTLQFGQNGVMKVVEQTDLPGSCCRPEPFVRRTHYSESTPAKKSQNSNSVFSGLSKFGMWGAKLLSDAVTPVPPKPKAKAAVELRSR